MASTTLLSLNDDVFLELLSYLDFSELASVRRVCRRFDSMVASYLTTERRIVVSSLEKVIRSQRWHHVKASVPSKLSKLQFYGKHCTQAEVASFGGSLPMEVKLLGRFLQKNFTNIKELSLTFCGTQVNDNNLAKFGQNLPMITTLTLSNLFVTDQGLSSLFPTLQNLSTLHLEKLKIDGRCFDRLPKTVKCLSVLTCHYLTTRCFNMFSTLSEVLTDLIVKPVPNHVGMEWLCQTLATSLTKLNRLELTSNNSLSCRTIQRFHPLEELSLKATFVFDPVYKHSDIFKNLKKFHFDIREINDHDLSLLLNRMPMLHDIRIVSYCSMLWEETLHTIGTLQALETLWVTTKHTGPPVNGVNWTEFLASLKNLTSLYLDHVTKEDAEEMGQCLRQTQRSSPIKVTLRYSRPLPKTLSVISNDKVKLMIE